MKHTPQTRARAARLVREGKSNPQVASATKTSTATIKRWKKDPDFLSQIHGAGVLTFGHVQVRAAESDVLEHVPCEESRVWIGQGEVLGSLLVEGATHLRAVFIMTPERVQAVRDSLEQKMGLPMLQRFGIEVVGYGQSLDDADLYYLISGQSRAASGPYAGRGTRPRPAPGPDYVSRSGRCRSGRDRRYPPI